MGFFKKLDDKIKSYLEKKIKEVDAKNEQLKLEHQEIKSNKKEQETNVSSLQRVSQLKVFKIKNIKDYGLFFMDLYEELKKRETIDSIRKDNYLDFFWLVGLATQGRIDEINEIIEETKIKNPNFHKIANNYKHQLIKMAKVSKRAEESDIGDDIKIGETIGEYISRKKLLKSKVYMTEFNFFKNLDYDSLF